MFSLSSETGESSITSTELFSATHISTHFLLFTCIQCVCLITPDRRLSAIEKDRQPQIMKILHSDDEYDEEDDDCSHNHSFISNDITRHEKEDKATTSANSSFQSISPGDVLTHKNIINLQATPCTQLMCGVALAMAVRKVQKG